MGVGTEKTPDYKALRELFKPHIESFDYLVEAGLETMFVNIKPVEVFDPVTNLKLRIWFGKPELYTPTKDLKSGMRDPLFPFECRLAKISYSGRFIADVCYQYNDGPVVREKFNFGQLPIMLKSKVCHLRGADPRKLVSYKEEANEMGGYFILNGLERLFRLLIMPKQNYPMSVVWSAFADRGVGYTDKAVTIRCVRVDQSAVTVKLYYLLNGSARLGFWIRGREYLLPVGVVLKALIDTNDHEIYVSLTCCYNEAHKREKAHQREKALQREKAAVDTQLLGEGMEKGAVGTQLPGERAEKGAVGNQLLGVRMEKGAVGTQLLGERVKIILDEVQNLSLFTRLQCLNHIGEYFRHVMDDGLETEKNSVVGEAVLRDYIFVHLDNNDDKFNLLIFMLQKLFALVDHTAAPDNPDTLQFQEVLLPGHLITIYLKEKLEDWLNKGRRLLTDEIKKMGKNFDFKSFADVKKVLDKNPTKQIGTAVETLLKTGRLQTQSGLDLQQRAGLTVQAERLNFHRFISHFRAVHRGATFTGLRTTTVRKLLPESWGFICPVHTPDGEPCGLLTHLTCNCGITSSFDSQGNIRDFFKIRMSIQRVLVAVGMTPSLPKLVRAGPPEVLFVILDGRVIGSIPSSEVEKAVAHIRRLKLSGFSGIPEDLEVGYVPLTLGGTYPGLYLFTSPSRFIRPVRNISLPSKEKQDIELIGPFEQVFMEIRCADGGNGGRKNMFPATHEEIHPTGMLSVVANLTPWSDHNQSPRNMYQCQMAKQTMGFSSQAIQFRADQKLYHLHTPQTPIVRTHTYTKYNMDELPTGTNAIVAVLAYSGYDMEDAMILNKSSVDRGLCHGSIYQTETIDLAEGVKSDQALKVFGRSKLDKSSHSLIDADGLPYVGQQLRPSDPYYSVYNTVTGATKNSVLKGSEAVIVDFVAVDMRNHKKPPQKASIRFRRPRNPVIGDKFSSRHGQKGVCSQLWPDIDMPFSGVTGMRPDLIINPHAFPSRMTIGMLLESIAAKGGSLHGKFVDATPFASSVKSEESSSESSSLVDELGSLMTSYGFNYHGVEVLYSGVLGIELTCEIFMGPVYYQRLRHMVSDKFQVRSTGTVDQVTRQPIKGRKRGGGIRFGEMERDSLLAHGAAYLLHDRLHTCSDHHIADVCSQCGSVLTASFLQPQKKASREIGGLPPGRGAKKVTCHACKTSKGMETVAMPYVFRYLAAELAAMNVKMTLKLSNNAEE